MTETVADNSGESQTVKYSTAVDRTIAFAVTVVDGDVAETDAAIEDVFEAYVLGLTVGEQPIALPLYAGLAALAGVANVTALTITGTVDDFEQAVCGVITITRA